MPTRPRLRACAAQNARKKLAEEKARKKAEEAERIRKENAEMKARPQPSLALPTLRRRALALRARAMVPRSPHGIAL